YQQSGDAKTLYFAQYSAVVEDSPVITPCTVIINNIPTKTMLKPLKTSSEILLIELFLLIADCIDNG
ncbi:MAG: hypothetical protein QOK89_05100, partial [Nitrososphaeraceae archaeon]|nr:hypothetical protein [Nitrososphaeraceae archaeon]